MRRLPGALYLVQAKSVPKRDTVARTVAGLRKVAGILMDVRYLSSVNQKEEDMNPTQAKFQDDLDEVASKLHSGIRSGQYTWADVQDRIKAKTTELANTTDEYLHEYTWTSLAVVACLSVLVGVFAARRR